MLKLMSLALILATAAACGKTESKRKKELPDRPQIALNAPQDIVGDWAACNVKSEEDLARMQGKDFSKLKNGALIKADAIVYSFKADGSVLVSSILFDNTDCNGAGETSVELNGTYVLGEENALDLKLGSGATVYRVYSVQNNVLLISNNPGFGVDAEHRDYYLNEAVLSMPRYARPLPQPIP